MASKVRTTWKGTAVIKATGESSPLKTSSHINSLRYVVTDRPNEKTVKIRIMLFQMNI
jgi:hypothetical protein